MRTVLAVIALLLLAVLLALAAPAMCAIGQPYGPAPASIAPTASWVGLASPPVGAIIATRNLNEADNDSIGYWNHLATVVGQGTDGRTYVVEAQTGVYGNGVQYTALDDFFRRPYAPAFYWVHRDPAVRQRMALIAQLQVGSPYGRLASLGPQRARGIVAAVLGVPRRENCVSTVRRQLEGATGTALLGFNIPDDIGRRPDLFAGPYPMAQPMGVIP